MTKQERYDRQTEAFEAYGRRMDVCREKGEALAHAAYENGQRVTEDERRELNRSSMFGSDSWPTQKAGRKWRLNHTLATGFGLFNTKTEAEDAWNVLLWKWIRLNGLEGRDRMLAELAARNAYFASQGATA